MSANDPNRRERNLSIVKEHPQVTSDVTVKVFKARVRTRVDAIYYENDDGLAVNAANFYAISAKVGVAVVADGVTTNSTGGAALVANTWVQMTNGAILNRTLAPGAELDLFLDATGAPTLPAGSVLVHLTELSSN